MSLTIFISILQTSDNLVFQGKFFIYISFCVLRNLLWTFAKVNCRVPFWRNPGDSKYVSTMHRCCIMEQHQSIFLNSSEGSYYDLNQYLAILLYVHQPLHFLLSLFISPSSYSDNLVKMQSSTLSSEKTSLQTLPNNGRMLLTVFLQSFHQLFNLSEKRKSSISAKHSNQMRLW